MTAEIIQYINSVATYAKSKGLDFTSAAVEYNEMNKATFEHLFSCYNHLRAKESRTKAIQVIGREVYNRINANKG